MTETLRQILENSDRFDTKAEAFDYLVEEITKLINEAGE